MKRRKFISNGMSEASHNIFICFRHQKYLCCLPFLYVNVCEGIIGQNTKYENILQFSSHTKSVSKVKTVELKYLLTCILDEFIL